MGVDKEYTNTCIVLQYVPFVWQFKYTNNNEATRTTHLLTHGQEYTGVGVDVNHLFQKIKIKIKKTKIIIKSCGLEKGRNCNCQLLRYQEKWHYFPWQTREFHDLCQS